ncbi:MULTISPECIES: hypothetical protein [unclassified Pseudomonas]|uniref:hypothetical protein n=1 Tax=unclassified Pseudomonas TaxID=196821 RepID=UPI000BCC1F17|nr:MULTISPECIES: hypothetical protein [unclassified Pseudomonas]PVZ16369.1 hypothetical protein F474_01888 [Pseudomonas sp. URIL14HWK12:I12]PVZ25775.1 hypothetical protein F470_01222 [Pseudomonas sp. URIL14HWK12:I10]PVZ36701.1 hypothetical protein F472_01888 [Pseudomonas sp. URIL14HWK12:I11]SNZ12789.1 hypothetical protein SAMN05660463_02199 [Pseudomonas sp. URIL14HWK12:I9]
MSRTWWLGLALLPGLAGAEVALDHSLSLRAGAWSGDRALTDRSGIATGSAWGRATLRSDELGELVFDGWAMAQSASQERGGLVREAFWRYDVADYSLKVGRQIVVWGRADAVNPTDNLSPRNYRLLTPVDGEQRWGNDGISLSHDSGWGTLQGSWYPHAKQSQIPLLSLPGVTYRQEDSQRDQWALKWDMTGDSADGSVSWFDGTDPLPVLVPGGIGPSGALVRVRAQHVRVLGADFSTTQGSTVWRAEVAYSHSGSDGASDFLHKKPQFAAVAGGEWQLPGTATLGVQLTWLHVFDYADARDLAPGFEREVAMRQLATSNQTRRDQLGFTWRLADRWLNDQLSLEFSGAANHSDGSGIARVQGSYRVSDPVTLKAGMDYYYGPQYSFLGQLRDNRVLYTQVEYGF